MAGNILRLGGASGLVIGEDGNETGITSITGTTALVDFGPDGFNPQQTAEAYIFKCWITLAANSLANYKAALALVDLWVSQTKDRSVEVLDSASNVLAEFILGDKMSYAEGVQNVKAGSGLCADIEVTFTIARFLISAGTGTAGGAEDPTGMQDAVTYGIQHDGDGSYMLTARARFRNTYGGAGARENAYAWARAWRGALPSFLPSDEKYEPVGMDTEGENQNLEVTATMRFRSIKRAIRSRMSLPAWVRNVVTEIVSQGGTRTTSKGTGGKKVGTLVTITSTIGLLTDAQTFGPFVPADIHDKASFAAIMSIAEQAISAAKSQSGQSLRPIGGLSLSLSDSGSTARAAQAFVGGSAISEWFDQLTNDEQFLQSYIRIYDGTERKKDGPPGGPVVTATQVYRTRSTSGWERPAIPAGFDVVKTTDTPEVDEEQDARGHNALKVYRVSGVRLLHRTPGAK